MAVDQAEDLGDFAGPRVVGNLHDFALAKMVAAAVGAELRDLLGELRQGIGGQEMVDPIGQGVAGCRRARCGPSPRTVRPIRLGCPAHGTRPASAFDDDLPAQRGIDPTRFRHVSLPHAGPGRSAIADRVDQRPADTAAPAIASAGRFNCSRLIEHLMSTPTGPG